jgi:hypothetical protein
MVQALCVTALLAGASCAVAFVPQGSFTSDVSAIRSKSAASSSSLRMAAAGAKKVCTTIFYLYYNVLYIECSMFVLASKRWLLHSAHYVSSLKLFKSRHCSAASTCKHSSSTCVKTLLDLATQLCSPRLQCCCTLCYVATQV